MKDLPLLIFKKLFRPRLTRQHYLKHKEAARILAHARLGHFNARYGFAYNRVSIKDTKGRWGSCSSKRNLNFSYKILFLSPEECDYVIVHELCHLKEMNHGPEFWRLVAEAVPDWQKHRASIRRGL